MQPADDRFRPDPAMTRDEMERLQREIAAEAVFADRFDQEEPVVVAGVDQAFTDETAVSGIVVMVDGTVVERASAATRLDIPYIPGLLAFREGNSILAAFAELERTPDLVLFDGSGRIHFREAGLATHMGVMLDVPSVGVAKNLLCGTPEQPVDDPLPNGTRIPIHADDSVETAAEETVIGYAYQSRQYEHPEHRHINPLYVSPGHRVSAETAVDAVERHCTDHKLPEPVHRADRYVTDAKTAH